MARLARLALPHHLHHLVQTGNNHQCIFNCTAHYQQFLQLLAEASRQSKVSIHAYVLMPDHFHLLATPNEDNNGLSQMMQALGRRYVRYFNDSSGRSGTLWAGRYRSTVLQPALYGLQCMVYVDLNCVRAGIGAAAAHYPWSSHAHYAGLRVDPLVTPHAVAWAMGNTPFAREAAYTNMVQLGLSPAQQSVLTTAVLRGWALGDEHFVANLQKKTKRRVMRAAVGRPALTLTSPQKLTST